MTKSPNPSSYKHPDAKRKMIPTAEQQGFVAEDETRPKKLRYPRNADLDPQFVWKGKDQEDLTDLLVDAPPVYKQEHIHPRAIIARLKAEAKRAETEDEPDDQMSMFAEFNGRPKDIEAHTEFYEHDQDWQNRMILGDSLMVMASLAERENLRGQVQAIYFDPPYGIKFNSNWQASTTDRNVKDGKSEHTSREPEVIRAFRDTWREGIHSYLSYLRDRLTLSRDLLKETGSIFVQIGDQNVHRLRALMDEVFGEDNFCAVIDFKTTSGLSSDYLAGTTDHIVWFFKDRSQAKFRRMFLPKIAGEEGATQFGLLRSADGGMFIPNKRQLPDWDVCAHDNLTSTGFATTTDYPLELNGQTFQLPSKTTRWKTPPDGMQRLQKASRVLFGGANPPLRQDVRGFQDLPNHRLVD